MRKELVLLVVLVLLVLVLLPVPASAVAQQIYVDWEIPIQPGWFWWLYAHAGGSPGTYDVQIVVNGQTVFDEVGDHDGYLGLSGPSPLPQGYSVNWVEYSIHITAEGYEDFDKEGGFEIVRPRYISVTVYEDLNENARRDPGEPDLNWPFTLEFVSRSGNWATGYGNTPSTYVFRSWGYDYRMTICRQFGWQFTGWHRQGKNCIISVPGDYLGDAFLSFGVTRKYDEIFGVMSDGCDGEHPVLAVYNRGERDVIVAVRWTGSPENDENGPRSAEDIDWESYLIPSSGVSPVRITAPYPIIQTRTLRYAFHYPGEIELLMDEEFTIEGCPAVPKSGEIGPSWFEIVKKEPDEPKFVTDTLKVAFQNLGKEAKDVRLDVKVYAGYYGSRASNLVDAESSRFGLLDDQSKPVYTFQDGEDRYILTAGGKGFNVGWGSKVFAEVVIPNPAEIWAVELHLVYVDSDGEYQGQKVFWVFNY